MKHQKSLFEMLDEVGVHPMLIVNIYNSITPVYESIVPNSDAVECWRIRAIYLIEKYFNGNAIEFRKFIHKQLYDKELSI